MQDRLRRLDALFAEKVLGLSSGPNCPGDIEADDNGWCWCDSCAWSGAHTGAVPHPFTPIAYTRSLDAALQGPMARFGDECLTLDHLCPRDRGEAPSWSATFYMEDGSHHQGVSDHPAEALVIACLRAVGVAEEEL